MLQKLLTIMLSLIMLIACNGCTKTPTSKATSGNSEAPTKSNINDWIELTANKQEINISESLQLVVTLKTESGLIKNITNEIPWTTRRESNFSYSKTNSGLLFGLHAGTKTIQVNYQGVLSNSLNITVKPTLFYATGNKLYASYGLINDNFPSYIYSLTIINNNIYSCCSAGISGRFNNLIGVLDFTQDTKHWSFINNKPNLVESSQEFIRNIKSVKRTLVAEAPKRGNAQGNMYWWDEGWSKWVNMSNKSFPFIELNDRLYAINVESSKSGDGVNYFDIRTYLPYANLPWQIFTTSFSYAQCKGDLHLLNTDLYFVSKQPSPFCLSSINIYRAKSSWRNYYPHLNLSPSVRATSSIVVGNTLYISFDTTVNGSLAIYAFKRLGSTESAPLIIRRYLPDTSATSAILVAMGTTLYAGTNTGNIWSLDTTKVTTQWQKVSLSNENSNSWTIDAMYVAY